MKITDWQIYRIEKVLFKRPVYRKFPTGNRERVYFGSRAFNRAGHELAYADGGSLYVIEAVEARKQAAAK